MTKGNSSKLKTTMTTTRTQRHKSLLQRTDLPPSDFYPITPVTEGISTVTLTPTHTLIRTLINTVTTTITTKTTLTQQRTAIPQLTLIRPPILTPME